MIESRFAFLDILGQGKPELKAVQPVPRSAQFRTGAFGVNDAAAG